MLEILTSSALEPVRHGFFTRKGGASSGIFHGLNCGMGSSDLTEMVEINRRRAAQAVGLELATLKGIYQVHSADVVEVRSTRDDLSNVKGDALVSRCPGVALAILTADCQPVLFSDPEAGVIGAAHAGWRGALSGVLEATIDAMEALGAKRGQIRAVVGPCISQAAYEVSPAFYESFTETDPDYARFFVPGKEDHWQFDLPGFGVHRLQAAGVGHAEWTGHCTYGDAQRFYSFRRTTHLKEADYGRLISVIRL